MAERLRIYFSGVGGQGTLTATNLLAHAALLSGYEALAGEVHGMAQRGGVVESFLLLGGWRSPRIDIGEADVVLAFEMLEALRALPRLKPDGSLVVAQMRIPPLSGPKQKPYPDFNEIKSQISEKVKTCYFLPSEEFIAKLGNVQSSNTAVLAAACAANLIPITTDTLAKAIRETLPAKLHETNLLALELGIKAVQQ